MQKNQIGSRLSLIYDIYLSHVPPITHISPCVSRSVNVGVAATVDRRLRTGRDLRRNSLIS